MVRVTVAIFFLNFFFACTDAGENVMKNLSVVKNDTFDFYNAEDDIPIAKGFSIDTIKRFYKRTDYMTTLICPEIIGKEFIGINAILKKEIKRKAAFNYVDSTNNEPVDTSKEVFGVVEDNILLQMYKNTSLVSYGFLSIFSDPKAMRPFRKYFTINYDAGKKKFISLMDYLKIETPSDSGFVKSIIYSKVGNPDTQWYTLKNQNFSFDKEYVYFYFDMFGETQIPYGEVKRVKKKYLAKFINKDYQ